MKKIYDNIADARTSIRIFNEKVTALEEEYGAYLISDDSECGISTVVLHKDENGKIKELTI